MQPSSLHDSIALRFDHVSHQFGPVPLPHLSWSLNDVGTTSGAILVERFRTYGSKFIDLSDYRARLEFGAKQLEISLPVEVADLAHNAIRLLDLNDSFLQKNRDVSVVVLVSPGVPSPEYPLGSRPTCMMHLTELPFAKLHDWYQNGTELSLAPHRVVPTECWPSQMKTRSRLPYLLSDAAVSAVNSKSLALLATTKGKIADTSVANFLMIDKSSQIISPPKEDILVGCTLLAVEKLLKRVNVAIKYRDIDPAELDEASEVVLTGSSGGIWFAGSINGQRIGRDSTRPRYNQLMELWKDYVGIDFVAQAAL
ncbi:MAG: aminotransferase class IV [Planctomycetota bacterium]|nr:aminotransferase class IV [Planctomycetota bacterium]